MQFDPIRPDQKTSPKPVTEWLQRSQEEITAQLANLSLDDPKFQQILSNYAALLQAAAIERINEAIELAADGPTRDKLLKCLLDALKISEKAASRLAREQAAKDKEERRLTREKEKASRPPKPASNPRNNAAKPAAFPSPPQLPTEPPLLPAPSLATRLALAAGASSPLTSSMIPHYNF